MLAGKAGVCASEPDDPLECVVMLQGCTGSTWGGAGPLLCPASPAGSVRYAAEGLELQRVHVFLGPDRVLIEGPLQQMAATFAQTAESANKLGLGRNRHVTGFYGAAMEMEIQPA